MFTGTSYVTGPREDFGAPVISAERYTVDAEKMTGEKKNEEVTLSKLLSPVPACQNSLPLPSHTRASGTFHPIGMAKVVDWRDLRAAVFS